VAPGVLLVLTDVIHDVGDDHGKPAEHGHQHGVVCGPFGQATEVGIHRQERSTLVVAELRATAEDPDGGLVVVRHSADGLLEGAVAVPGVIVHDDAGLEPSEGILVDASDAVVGEVQHLQRGLDAAEGSFPQGLHRVVREVEFPQEPQSVEGLIRHGADLVVVQPQQDGVQREARGDFLEAGLTAGHVEAVEVEVALADAALWTHAGRGEAQGHEDEALKEQAHGDGARQPQVQQSHTDRPSAASRLGPQHCHWSLTHIASRRPVLTVCPLEILECGQVATCCVEA